MKERKFRPFMLFYNNRFVMIFSILVGIILWFIMATMNTTERPRVLTDIPVTVTLSDDALGRDLRVFSQSVTTARVSIRGNSVAVYNVKPEDLRIVAEGAASITQPTSTQLPLKVERLRQLAGDYTITVEPTSVFIDVDYYKEFPFDIDTSGIEYRADPDYLVNEPSLSVESVLIAGPEKEIDKIDKVVVEKVFTGALTETQNFTADLVLYDKYGEKIDKSKFTMSVDQVDVTISVLSRRESELEPTFLNRPAGLILTSDQIKVEPEKIQVAGAADVLANLTSITLEPIDFSEVSPTNIIFTLNVTLPPGCKNISMIHEATVTLDLSDFVSKKFTVDQFRVSNLAASKTSEVYTKSLDVTLVGPENQIDALSEEDIVAVIDMTGKETFTGHIEMPVSFDIENGSSVWAYGKYQASLSVEEN